MKTLRNGIMKFLDFGFWFLLFKFKNLFCMKKVKVIMRICLAFKTNWKTLFLVYKLMIRLERNSKCADGAENFSIHLYQT